MASIKKKILKPPKHVHTVLRWIKCLQTVPEKGTVTVPGYDFPQQFSEFSFRTLLTKNEVSPHSMSASINVTTAALVSRV